MSRLSRRSLFAGMAGTAGLTAVGRLPGTHLVRAQSAAYEIVSFGPITEGVMGEGQFRPDLGSILGIHANGTSFGSTPASAEKMYPALFAADGTLTKLKSGTFGGKVMAMNNSGVAAGSVFENAAGTSTEEDYGERPAAWIDGDLVRLDLPADKRYGFSLTGGYANSVSDDGVIYGVANGYRVLWVDGAIQILPEQSDAGDYIYYSRIAPDGSLIGYRTYEDADGNDISEYGTMDGTTFSAVATSGFGASSFYVSDINSASELLLSGTPTDLPLDNIAGVGLEPVVIDLREQGIYFTGNAFNADHDIVGSWRERQDLDFEPAIMREGEITPLAAMLRADHGLENLFVSGISDDGVISGSGWDADGAYHPLLFVPA